MNLRQRGFSIPTVITKSITRANGLFNGELLFKGKRADKPQGFFEKIESGKSLNKAHGNEDAVTLSTRPLRLSPLFTGSWQDNACLKTTQWKNDKLLKLIPWFFVLYSLIYVQS